MIQIMKNEKHKGVQYPFVNPALYLSHSTICTHKLVMKSSCLIKLSTIYKNYRATGDCWKILIEIQLQ
jgi:hypothetical protein